MTERLKMLLAAVAVVAAAVLLWGVLVSPARQQADQARAARDGAESQAALVVGQLTEARAAVRRAPDDARTLRRLAVAVPEKVEAAALLDQLDATAKRYKVSFDVLKVDDPAASADPAASGGAATGGSAETPATGSGGSGGALDATTSQPAQSGKAISGNGGAGTTTPTTPTTTPTTPATTPTTGDATAAGQAADAGAGAAGSIPVQLSVQIGGSYVAVTRFVRAVQGSVALRGTGIAAHGRLLRIDSINLAVGSEGGSRKLTGTLDVVAYLLPPEATASAATTPTATPTTGDQP